MSILLADISKYLPIEDSANYRGLNKILFEDLNRTCVVIDDDPTGNQTVHDIPLLTTWDLDTLIQEFENKTPVFFLLTNSRSLSQEKSTGIFHEITRNILKASEYTNREFTIISRSDSTLRGHFSEIETVKEAKDSENDITFFIPVMFEGGRVTVNDVHYISENEKLIPVNQTSFSQDHTFAYSNANLKEYIQERTQGKVSVSTIFSFDLDAIRTLDVENLSEQINDLKPGQYAVTNALNYNDLDKFCNALLLAEKSGKSILYRTSSSFVPSYIGIKPRGLLKVESIINTKSETGGITIVGSYVSKSSKQLNCALKHYEENSIVEVNVETILGGGAKLYLATIITKIDEKLASGNDVILYTSRKLVTGTSANSNIDIAATISSALVHLVKGITVSPKYIVAKGGITSHDLAKEGLGMKRSMVLGQILPGIPVWKMGEETKFPNLSYIVFPGNVGDEKSLLTITQKLS